MIRLYNSASRTIENFVPGDPTNVMMYVCGPTVYDTPHLGNARPAVIFDVLYRVLMEEFGNDESVFYARNYTDIDDKIIERAAAEGIEIDLLTTRVGGEYIYVTNELGNWAPTHTPHATDFIDHMQAMISRLIASGNAYENEGHVFFDVASWPSHGILTGHKQENLEAGHNDRELRGGDLKRAQGDFVLWKPSADGVPGWDSPWGRGRPGWHIECSAMIDGLFESQTIDIHGGGADLRFPHHECEISQFSACNHHSLARYWVHNGMVTVDGQKMAKSTGNFITVIDLLDRGIPGQAIRLALLNTQYRSSLDWTEALIQSSIQTLTGWHRALELVDADAEYNTHAAYIISALNNDLNTPLAISRIHEKMTQIAEDAESIAAGVRYAARILGLQLDFDKHDKYLRGLPNRFQIEQLVSERVAARKTQNWAESDRLRAAINDLGVVVEDGPQGTSWRRA